jgi:LETM1 and EF-hand domain-containing protein 1
VLSTTSARVGGLPSGGSHASSSARPASGENAAGARSGAEQAKKAQPVEAGGSEKKVVKRKKAEGLSAWLWDQCLHIYHGFRLFFVNVGVTWRLKKQLRAGQKLTRRERLLLERTTQDMMKLIPFSAFIIIPGAELLLPVALALFPNLMPSTFDTSESLRRNQMMANLRSGISRRRLFEQMTLRVLMHDHFEADSGRLAVFKSISKGGKVTENDILQFVPLFEEPDGPLALKKLEGYVLKDLGVLTGTEAGLTPFLEKVLFPRTWYEVRMRRRLDEKLELFEEDDACLMQSDLSAFTLQELQHECIRRRMRWLGSADSLRKQLEQWLSLSINPDVPNHLLLFLLPCATTAEVYLKHTTKEEREHVLGLKKYRDAPSYQFIRTMMKKTKAKSDAELSVIQVPIMEEDIEKIKREIEEVRQEDIDSKMELGDVREDLRLTTDAELMEMFDALMAKHGMTEGDRIVAINERRAFAMAVAGSFDGAPSLVPEDENSGVVGVAPAKVGQGLVELLRKQGKGITKCLPSRIFLALQDFDVDSSDLITREDFQAYITRMRNE